MNKWNPSWLRVVLLLAVFSVGVASQSAAQDSGAAQCRTVPSAILGRAVRYCVLLPPSYATNKTRRFPIVYSLHGLGGNEQWLLRGGAWDLVEQAREQNKIGEFVIASPDGGRSFYVNSRDRKERYEDFFIKEFIPAIERRYRAGGTRQARALSGFSMGGYGALHFAFEYPQMFAAVAVHSAALFENLPEDATVAFGRQLQAFGNPLDHDYWNQNNPLTLAQSAPGLSRLKIYFDCGQQDDYGFDAGARRLDEILKRRNIAHEFHLYPGGHSWEYVADHFAESLAFLSHALGLK